jgi:hypothetical protein
MPLAMSTSQEVPQSSRQRLTRTRMAGRQILAPANLGFVVVTILCALTIASFALGFALQPSASTPAGIPDPPRINLSFQSGRPLSLFIYSFLKQDNDQNTRLIISAAGTFASSQASIRWTIGILAFTGHLCPRQGPASGLIPLRGFPHDYELNGFSRVPALSGQPFLDVSLCWDKDAPLVINGSYFSAALSPILAQPGQDGSVTRSLVLSGTSLSSYSLAGGISPTEATARSWIWTDNLSSNFQSQARAEIPVIASSLPGIQRDNRDIFYSGVFFGIAGGAAVSVIPALIDAFDRKKSKGARSTTAKQEELGETS